MIYQPTLSQESNSYNFTTESGHVYNVYFDKTSPIFPLEELDEHAVYFGFTCRPKHKKHEREHDPKIGATIIWLVAQYFLKNKKAILVYVCLGDEIEDRVRSIAFGKWYNESQLKEKILLKRKIIGRTYTGVLISKKNPLLDALEIAIEDFHPDKFDPENQDEDDIIDVQEDNFL